MKEEKAMRDKLNVGIKFIKPSVEEVKRLEIVRVLAELIRKYAQQQCKL